MKLPFQLLVMLVVACVIAVDEAVAEALSEERSHVLWVNHKVSLIGINICLNYMMYLKCYIFRN